MQIVSDLKELYTRLTSPTPAFFKKARKLGAVMAAGGLAGATFPNPHLANVAGYVATIGGTIVAVSSAAKSDAPEDKK